MLRIEKKMKREEERKEEEREKDLLTNCYEHSKKNGGQRAILYKRKKKGKENYGKKILTGLRTWVVWQVGRLTKRPPGGLGSLKGSYFS